MKTIYMVLIYLGTVAGLFLILSLFGVLWTSYKVVITDPQWFVIYLFFFSWNVPIWVCRSYYLDNQEYFDR